MSLRVESLKPMWTSKLKSYKKVVPGKALPGRRVLDSGDSGMKCHLHNPHSLIAHYIQNIAPLTQ